MNVLFVTQIVPYPPHGGVLQRGYNLVRQMSRHGSIDLLAFVHPDILSDEHRIAEAARELRRYCRTVEFFPLWPKRSRFHQIAGYLAALFVAKPFSVLAHRSAAMRRRIREILATNAIDIVHFDTIALAQYDSEDIRVPRALTHHNIESKLMARRANVERHPLARFYLRLQARRLERYERLHGGRFDINIMMSDLDASDLREIAPDAVTEVVPNGVDIGYFVPRHGEEQPAVIYTGGMNMYANRDAVLYFVDAVWPLIRREIPTMRFLAIGQDPPEELRRLATPDSGIEVLGFVPDIRPYVAKSAVYIVPLRVGGGTRLKVVDAMAQGKAIVSTSIGCEGIDVEPGATIEIADTPEEFARAVVALARDPARRDRMGDAARALAEKRYAWQIIGDKLIAAYELAVARGRHRVGPGA